MTVTSVDDATFYNRETGELKSVAELRDEAEEATQLDRIEDLLGQVLARMDSTEKMVAAVVAEVKPTIDELLNSGLGRMLGIKKKAS